MQLVCEASDDEAELRCSARYRSRSQSTETGRGGGPKRIEMFDTEHIGTEVLTDEIQRSVWVV